MRVNTWLQAAMARVIFTYVALTQQYPIMEAVVKGRKRTLQFSLGSGPSTIGQAACGNLTRRRWLGSLALVAVIVGMMFAPVPAARAENTADDARSVLKAMADYLISQKTIEYTFDSSIEVITPDIQKIQYTSSGHALLERPDKLRVSRLGGTGELDLFFNGQTATLYGPGIKTYAEAGSASSIDQLIDELEHKYGFAGPGADLLLSNAYDTLMANVTDAKYLGTGIIGGVTCDHVAFRTHDTDWQLWVQIGGEAIPRKFVITSKTIAAAPEYSVVVTDWKTGAQFDASAFVFTPPPEAKKGTLADLAGLDEFPHSAALGEN